MNVRILVRIAVSHRFMVPISKLRLSAPSVIICANRLTPPHAPTALQTGIWVMPHAKHICFMFAYVAPTRKIINLQKLTKSPISPTIEQHSIGAYSSVVEYRFPKPLTEVQVLVGPQQKTNIPPANSWWYVSLVHALRHVRLLREAECCEPASHEPGSRALSRIGTK